MESDLMAAPSFSVTVLEALRRGRYRPQAWWRLLTSSWRQARLTARTQPELVADWRRLTGMLGVATLSYVVYTTRRHGRRVAWRSTLPLTLATLTQVGDIYVHLGLHRQTPDAHHPRLGSATSLTALRQWVGAVGASRLAVGMPLTDAEMLAALAVMVGTDVADGWLARRQQTTSALGRYLDAEADLLAWTALTLTHARRGQLPAWFVAVYGLRWGVPLALGFGRSFVDALPVTLAPSRLARLTGAAQVALAVVASGASLRADQADAPFWIGARRGLLAAAVGLLVATTGLRVARLIRR